MTTATDFVSDLRERMAEDGFALPETWEGMMEAVVAGAIDFDDVGELAHECAEVAQRYSPGTPVGWRHIAMSAVTRVVDDNGSGDSPAAKQLIAMGRAADEGTIAGKLASELNADMCYGGLSDGHEYAAFMKWASGNITPAMFAPLVQSLWAEWQNTDPK